MAKSCGQTSWWALYVHQQKGKVKELEGDTADSKGATNDPTRVTKETRYQDGKITSRQTGKDVCKMEVGDIVCGLSERRDADDRTPKNRQKMRSNINQKTPFLVDTSQKQEATWQ